MKTYITILFSLAISTCLSQNIPTAWTTGWSHDDKFVAVGNSNGELSIYETTNWKKIKALNYKSTTITRLEWNPKYPILAVAAYASQGSPSIVQLFDMTKNKVTKTLSDTVYGRALTWSPSGEEIAYVGSRGKISIYTKDGVHKKSLSFSNQGSLFEIDWHPSKNILLGVEEDMFLIDIDHDSVLARYDDGAKNKGILTAQWHPSGEFFVTGDYGHEGETEPSYVKFWNKQGKLLKQIKESKAEYRNVRWSKDGKYLAATGDVLLLLNEKAEVVKKIRFDENFLWGVSFNSKGDKIISSDQAGNVRITDLNGKILKQFRQ